MGLRYRAYRWYPVNPLNLIRVIPAKGRTARFSPPSPDQQYQPHPEEVAERGRLEGWTRTRLCFETGRSHGPPQHQGHGVRDEQAARLRRIRHAEGHHRPAARLAQGSRRADAAPDLRVPVREIVLTRRRERAEPAGLRHLRRVHRQRCRDRRRGRASSASRVDWVRERGGIEEYEGRPIKPVDNGNVTGKHLARNFPNTPKPMRAASSPLPSRERSTAKEGARPAASQGSRTVVHPITQLEWARAASSPRR